MLLCFDCGKRRDRFGFDGLRSLSRTRPLQGRRQITQSILRHHQRCVSSRVRRRAFRQDGEQQKQEIIKRSETGREDKKGRGEEDHGGRDSSIVHLKHHF